MEVEDEEDIFVGYRVTCMMKIVHKNQLPEGVSVEEVMKGETDKESESEEEEMKEVKEEKNDKMALSVEELREMSVSELKLEKDIVYSQRYLK